jgi:hypothetical protein
MCRRRAHASWQAATCRVAEQAINTVLLGAVAVIDDRLQALAISRAQIDGDASTHPADSHDAKAKGIPTRTLTSASIH